MPSIIKINGGGNDVFINKFYIKSWTASLMPFFEFPGGKTLL